MKPGWWARCLVGAFAVVAGCGRPPGPEAGPGDRDRPVTGPSQAIREQLLAGAVTILSGLDRHDPVRGGEQVFDRLVQWSHAARDGDAWRADPLIGSLPRELAAVAGDGLARDLFDSGGDVVAIRDRLWLAAIARAARGDARDDLDTALALFRWTVRSLASVSDPPMVPSESAPGSRWFLPGEILLSGRGSGPQRAWIFIELLRQAGLDGVMLATPAAGGGPPRPWLPALVSGGDAYLFEPVYGMPVPGPGGEGVATVRQAAADPAILAALSLPDRPYPVKAADLAGLGVLVVADAWSLSRRMARLDRDLAVAHGVSVAIEASAVADRAAAAVSGKAGTVSRGLWTFPWTTVARRNLAAAALADELAPLEVPLPSPAAGPDSPFVRPLFAGRVRDFRGEFAGPAGAKAAYMAARPSRRAMADAVAALPEAQGAAMTRRLVRMKEDATYWLGLVMLAEGQFAAAEDYLRRMTLEAAPDGRWTDAARVNLAAALVGLGRAAEAAAVLREDSSPQRFGSRILAARLAPPVPAAASTAQP